MLLVSRLLTVHTQSLVSTDNRSEVNEMVKLLSMVCEGLCEHVYDLCFKIY